MFVGFGQGVFGFVGGGFHQAGHGLEGLGSVEDEFRKVEDVGAPDLGFMVVEEVAGPPNVVSRGHGGTARVGFGGVVGAGEDGYDVVDAGLGNVEVAGSGQEGGNNVFGVGGGGTEHNNRVRRGLLHGFQEGVGGGVGKPVGVVEDDDAPFANGGEHGGGGDDFGAHGFDANGEFSGGDVHHVGVGASLHLAALFTGAAADDVWVGAFEGGGEGDGGVGSAGSGWAGEEPGVGHRAAPTTTTTTGTLTITGMIGTSHPTVTTASTTAGGCRGGAKGGSDHSCYTHLGENIIVHSLII